MATKDELILQRIDDLKEQTEKRLESIDKNLADHMEQTMLVREQNLLIKEQNKELAKQTEMLIELHKDHEARMQILEEPRKFLNFTKRVVVYLAAVSGAAISVIKLLEYLP